MKMILKPMLFIFIIMALFSSCNNEELFTEPTAEEIVDPNTPDDETPEDSEEEPVNASAPCDFNLNNLQPNQTVIIDCIMDLNGATIQVPSGVTLVYEGGAIINGTLNFSNNTTVSGDLLNNTLTLTGSNPIMKDPVFRFIPNKWGIVEGKVSNDVALNNRNILQSLIDRTKLMGIEVFEIDKMDAYFHFNYGWYDAKEYDAMAIHLPSNFHLKMTDNTHLRLQPNNWPKGVFVSVYEKQNVKISGGNIYGDRFTHDYSDILDEVGISRATHEWPGLIIVAGSVDVLVDSVYLTDSTGDAFIFGASTGFRHLLPNKSYNQNVVLKNSTLNASRRNNISITDGENLTVENCIIANTGNGDNIYDASGNKIISSAGIAPKVGIDIEPFRGWDSNGNAINYEIVDGVIIKGCTFTDNNVASFINYSGSNVTFENNFSDNCVGASYDNGTDYLYNTLEASEKNRGSRGIFLGTLVKVINGITTELSVNSKVVGNNIKGFDRGIEVAGDSPILSNNNISDFNLAIRFLNTKNVICENNIIESSREVHSQGLSFGSMNVENIVFNKNSIKVPRTPVYFSNFNKGTSYKTVFDNCTFESGQGYKLSFNNADNITVKNSTLINTSIEKINCTNFVEQSNTYK